MSLSSTQFSCPNPCHYKKIKINYFPQDDTPSTHQVQPNEIRVTEQPIASTESLDSFDSLPQQLVDVSSLAPQNQEGTDFGGAQSPPTETTPAQPDNTTNK